MLAKDRGVGTATGLVAGVTGPELGGGRSHGGVSGAGFVAESWRGRFGSGVGVVGSVCRLRPRIEGSAIAKGGSRCTDLLEENRRA